MDFFLFRQLAYAFGNSSSTHPNPLGNLREFAHIVSPSSGAFRILSRPRGWPFAYPRESRAFDIWPQHQHKAAENRKKGTGNAKVSQQRKASRCIGLRGKHYFLHNRKQGVFSKQNVENCSFPQKLQNIVIGPYKVAFS